MNIVEENLKRDFSMSLIQNYVYLSINNEPKNLNIF